MQEDEAFETDRPGYQLTRPQQDAFKALVAAADEMTDQVDEPESQEREESWESQERESQERESWEMESQERESQERESQEMESQERESQESIGHQERSPSQVRPKG